MLTGAVTATWLFTGCPFQRPHCDSGKSAPHGFRRFSAFPCNKNWFRPVIKTARRASKSGPSWPFGRPKGQYIRTKVARRASSSGPSWPEGPVHTDQAGPKGHYIRTKLARRARKSGPNWPEGLVSHDQTKSETRSRNSKLEIETRNS